MCSCCSRGHGLTGPPTGTVEAGQARICPGFASEQNRLPAYPLLRPCRASWALCVRKPAGCCSTRGHFLTPRDSGTSRTRIVTLSLSHNRQGRLCSLELPITDAAVNEALRSGKASRARHGVRPGLGSFLLRLGRDAALRGLVCTGAGVLTVPAPQCGGRKVHGSMRHRVPT